jgi:hypothetical protein
MRKEFLSLPGIESWNPGCPAQSLVTILTGLFQLFKIKQED